MKIRMSSRYLRKGYHLAREIMWRASVRFEMFRDSNQRHDDYVRRVYALHRMLGIPRTYADRGLPFYRYPAELVAVSTGVFEGQQCLMTPRTRSQWRAMHTTAANDGVGLQIRWAFRSADQQAKLIRDQLAWGGKLDYLLTWIAAPGYSEHHTGRALDLDSFPPAEKFEDTSAFDWLCNNAWKFGFKLSYPIGNDSGFIYEPWHWCYQDIIENTALHQSCEVRKI
jgi:D-alanyl-D-alanine carboxypeptidase